MACLERRYGGRRARRAAVIIQRAYRRYALDKKFRAITLSAKSERRLSRRFEVPPSWRHPAAAAPAPAAAAAAVRQTSMARQMSGTSGHSSGLNGSQENDSDLSDREYQSYGFLNDSTYLSEFYTPPCSTGLSSSRGLLAVSYMVSPESCQPRLTGGDGVNYYTVILSALTQH